MPLAFMAVISLFWAKLPKTRRIAVRALVGRVKLRSFGIRRRRICPISQRLTPLLMRSSASFTRFPTIKTKVKKRSDKRKGVRSWRRV